MRLKSIKLAGFKSFVDPTHLELPGQLIGVVGPNGCGKSNIIDAVRWVLGESRASELRGESMQDVIFNGSGLRKPSGRASVELVFDNIDGRPIGQWGAFAELSVRRVLTRDGSSSYFINNQAVRRKDIHDIFLGTGLGPRAYAIIGQGMISRIIEAKPEELRIFLEETAGVSKYKERRKETQTRLEDTYENLTRVEDIVRELDHQLLKLSTQAEVANKYKELQAQATLQQQILWMMKLADGQKEEEKYHQETINQQVLLEEKISQLRHLESDIEQKRSEQYSFQDQISSSQGELYEFNSLVAQNESEIRFINDSKIRLQKQIEDINNQLEKWEGQSELSQVELKQIASNLILANENELVVLENLTHHESLIPQIESGWLNSQSQVQDLKSKVTDIEKSLISINEKLNSANSQVELSEQRSTRLKLELEQLIKPSEEAKVTAIDRYTSAETKRISSQANLELAEVNLLQADKARQVAQINVQEANQLFSNSNASLEALTHLQERVQAQGKLRPWLESHQLQNLPRLWQMIQVEGGWETAIEAILGERISAIQSQAIEDTIQFVELSVPSKVAWYQTNAKLFGQKSSSLSSLTPILSRIQVKDIALQNVITEWFHQVYVVNSVSEAIAKRDELPQGGIFVDKAGHIISRVGIQLYAPDTEQAGLIGRAKEIEHLGKQLKSHQMILDESQGELQRSQSSYQAIYQTVIQARQTLEHAIMDVHRFEVDKMQLDKADENYASRANQIIQEISENESIAKVSQEKIIFSLDEKNKLDLSLENFRQLLDQSTLSYQEFNTSRDFSLKKKQEFQSAVQEASFELRSLKQRNLEIERDVQTAQEQINQLKDNLYASQNELVQFNDEILQEKLQVLLIKRSAQEATLAKLRTDFDAFMYDLRQLDEQRIILERSLEPIREKTTELQLKEQASRLATQQFMELLLEVDADLDSLKQQIDPSKKINVVASEVNQLNSQISQLGPINMAALEELSSSQERKNFLDAQSADLREAIETLTDVISKIDSETRDLLKNTFDQVNLQFSELFPALFGGGQAKLVMTGEEILDAGVQVMAQPPGKKNTTIHLLSGGEKALTAIALVFSLFHLNPAPFCLLDEVDAPLDDANTVRYSEIVAKMSQKTQFLFISHNKITMEIANQLIGVTMQEQGVSRIVAVDLLAAAAMVQTS
ncbi:MAG: chromosome segregation protein SMC [Betaproteobacteria bacterium]